MTQKPDFVCVGLPKAGTSTLHYVLDQHNDIAMPPVKELKFFNQTHLGLAPSRLKTLFTQHWTGQQDRAYLYRFLKKVLRGETNRYQLQSMWRYYTASRTDHQWYQRLFHDKKVSGDITVNYFMLPDADIAQIKQLYPQLKVIILLRSPVRLHWSYFRMVGLRKGENDVFLKERFLSEIETKKTNIGRYLDLVTRWRNVFGHENTYVAYFEELESEPYRFFANLCDFLEVTGPDDWSAEQKKAITSVVNMSPQMDIPEFHANHIASLCQINIEGYQRENVQYAKRWQADIEALLDAHT